MFLLERRKGAKNAKKGQEIESPGHRIAPAGWSMTGQHVS
jgi:hypothetical protein